MPKGKMQFGKPTRQDMTDFVPHATTGANSPPLWHGGEYFIKVATNKGGRQNSGPSGKRHTRYHAPVDDGKKVTKK